MRNKYGVVESTALSHHLQQAENFTYNMVG
jgi:hypothetical protein